MRRTDAPVGPPIAVTVAPATAPPVELITVPVTVAGIAVRVIVPREVVRPGCVVNDAVVCDTYPPALMVAVNVPAGMVMEKLPDALVDAVAVVPLSETVAPATLPPRELTTVPVTVDGATESLTVPTATFAPAASVNAVVVSGRKP